MVFVNSKLPSTVLIVIVAVPSLIPNTNPEELTFATDSSLEVFTVSVFSALIGDISQLRFIKSPT